MGFASAGPIRRVSGPSRRQRGNMMGFLRAKPLRRIQGSVPVRREAPKAREAMQYLSFILSLLSFIMVPDPKNALVLLSYRT